MANQNSDCQSCSEKDKGTCDPKSCSGIQKLPQSKGNNIKQVIAVMSGKGGVGKSSISSLLATSLAKQGHKVGILDADITGPSIPKMFGINDRPVSNGEALLPIWSKRLNIKIMSLNLLIDNEDDPVIWRGPILSGAVKQFWTDVAWGDLDYMIVDLPPGTGDVPLTVMQSIPLTGVVIVSSPQDLANMIVRKAIKLVAMEKVPIIGLVENMSGVICPHCGEKIDIFGESKAEQAARLADIPLLKVLPIDPKLSKLCDQGEVEKYDQVFDDLKPFLKTGKVG
ncbi:Mrp/NBP35 family ATP-binding protein [Desulfolucanica intricata]|uniref:Mrp/NBP35 family ATP-binding protein n=1 Tax=Desulfolucanica intricata TaxID=1285191 RepID=UPI000833AA98|nr:Mrp/NBP35 family ATP-binding protein [Desulfolucanica intricata]